MHSAVLTVPVAKLSSIQVKLGLAVDATFAASFIKPSSRVFSAVLNTRRPSDLTKASVLLRTIPWSDANLLNWCPCRSAACQGSLANPAAVAFGWAASSGPRLEARCARFTNDSRPAEHFLHVLPTAHLPVA